MTDQEVCKLLAAIHDLALVPYPFSDEVDERLCFALGQIVGLAEKALADVKEPKS